MAGDSIVDDLGAFLKNQRHTAQMSLRELATAAGVSNPYLSQIERGLRRPSADVLQQIAHGLQISAAALYARAGLLDDMSTDTADKAAPDTGTSDTATSEPATSDPATSDPATRQTAAPGRAAFETAAPVAAAFDAPTPGAAATSAVVSAIRNDLHLDPLQRRALIDVYSAFVRDGRTNRE